MKYYWPEEVLEAFVSIFLNVHRQGNTNLCNVMLSIVGALMTLVNESVMACLQKELAPWLVHSRRANVVSIVGRSLHALHYESPIRQDS